MDKVEIHIPGSGYYVSDEAIFADFMANRRRDDMLREVIDRCAEAPGDRTLYRSLRKFQLAGMLADFETGARANRMTWAD